MLLTPEPQILPRRRTPWSPSVSLQQEALTVCPPAQMLLWGCCRPVGLNFTADL